MKFFYKFRKVSTEISAKVSDKISVPYLGVFKMNSSGRFLSFSISKSTSSFVSSVHGFKKDEILAEIIFHSWGISNIRDIDFMVFFELYH